MYYVYELIDPRTDVPFYVGKGKGDRADMHYKRSEWWYNKRKAGRIKKLLELNLRYYVNKVFFTEYETEATLFETKLIQQYGRIGFEDNGILLNLSIDANPPSRKGKPGTFKGKTHSSATKEILREHNKKQFEDPQQRILRKNKSIELWQNEEYRLKQKESSKNRTATKPSKYKVYFPDGSTEIIINLSKWCKENNYPCGTLRDTLPQRKNNIPTRGRAKGMYIRIYNDTN